MTYSRDIRLLVCKRIAAGATHRAVAAEFDIAPSTAGRIARQGVERPRPTIKRRRRLDAYRETLLAWIEDRNDMTLKEMSERLFSQFGIHVALATLSDWWRAQGYTYKKRKRLPANIAARM